MIARRGFAATVAGVAVVALLAGCAASGVDPVARAESVFDELVAEASALDAETLRTVEIGPSTEQACGPDETVVSTGFTATATLPVAVTGLVLDGVADDLIATLDPQAWLPIAPSADLDQRAVQHEDGTTATITTADRLLVIAVFTPCASRD